MSSRASRSTPSDTGPGPGLFLGADGGGSSTVLCVLRDDGRVLARVEAPSSYYLGHGIDLVAKVLADGVAEACERAGTRPSDLGYAFFGLPGYGEVSADVAALDAAPAAALGHDRYACGNDMVCGWAGSLGAADGVNVVAGTGSIAYGERDGHGVRVGGWGEVFGDEGSGYWLAVRGLGLFSQMSDGRLPRGPLHPMLREHLRLETDLDLVDVVLNRWSADRGRVAALSRVVVDAAEAGDEQAAALVEDAAAALVAHVETARERLAWPDTEAMPVSWSGGMFAAAAVRDGFTRRVQALPRPVDLRAPLHDPAVGAALHAARLSGRPLPVDQEVS